MQRQLKLPGGASLLYTLKISTRRRTLGLRIDRSGLTVHVPGRLPQGAVEAMLQDKSGWIARKLAEIRPSPPALEWRDGAMLRYLGGNITLALRQDAKNRAVTLEGSRLYVALPNPNEAARVQHKVLKWYARQARADFSRRLALLAARLGVDAPVFYLSNAKTRWGSCNARGEIRLNWRLIQAPPHIIHYVVAHELAHLKEMNHSPKFWTWVEKLCPNYIATRKALKTLSAQLHII